MVRPPSPGRKNVMKLINLFEGGPAPLVDLDESLTDDMNRNQATRHQKVPVNKNAISGPTDGKKLVPERDLTAPGNSPSTNDWQSKDLGDVVLRIRDIENKYDRRQRYQSIFTNAPLYQVYSQRVARKETKREARRRHDARQTSAKVSPGDHPTGSNSLEFDDALFEPIDSDDREFGDPVFPDPPTLNYNPDTIPPEVPKHGIPTDLNHRWDTEELAGAAAEIWKRNASTRGSSRSTGSESRKSPPVVDNRTRIRSSDGSRSPDRTGSLNRTPSSPTRPRYPQSCSLETKSFAQEIAGTGPNRAMWCNMPQVIAAGLSTGLSSLEKKLQEALFEIITSEASYYRSLNVLIEVFYKAPCMQPGTPGAVITHTQKHHLFSNILEIHLTSENFLSAMEACFREDPMLKNLCEIVYEHAESRFDTYVPYVQNQMYQTRTL
ncbi:unnamed protein product [Echinostoma caproni]|uniref:DH domain-containing protein n=1 Tax=Echinostoma caproni TaxID=27848 RepID=A0A183A5H4_9TREM|nr:unnamed protein product [Echinostoma caproni]